jgi:tetratricopeptide (TPR) repeat protein
VGILFSAYGLMRPVSTLGNTNYAGVLAAVLAITGLAAAIFQRGWRRVPGIGALVLGVLHVGATGSLAGRIGLGAGCAAFAALLVLRHGWKPVVAIPFVILVAALAPAAKRVSDVARGEDRTGNVRLGLWKGTAKLAAAHPILGCGTGNFRMEFTPYRDAAERKLSHEGRGLGYVEAEDPHNSYLAVLAESGPVALIAIGAMLALAIAGGIRAAKDPAGLAPAAAAGLIALAVSAMFNSLSSHLPFAVVAGILAGVTRPVAEPLEARRWSLAWAAAAVLLALAPLPWFAADLQYRAAMHTSRPDERLVHAQRAVDALPGHWEARYQIAKCWRAMGQGEGSAQVALREVLKLHPHHVPAMIELAAGLPPPEQEELLLRAERLAPESVVIQTRLAGADLRRRDFPGARRRLERMLQTMPDEPETLYTIGRTWLLERKFEQAIPWLRRAGAKMPNLKERIEEDHPEVREDSRFTEFLKR